MWPWNRQRKDTDRLADLEQAFGKLQADTRAALREVSELSERAYKFLKRAEARARRELDATPNQESAGGPEAAVPITPEPSGSHRGPWGARGRRLARAMRPAPDLNGAGEDE